MAASLPSSLSSTTVSSASLRRLPPHRHHPNSLPLPKPTRFPSVRAQSSPPEKGGDPEVEKAGEEANEISMDALKEESAKVNKEVAEMKEKGGEETDKDGILDVARDVAEKTTEKVADIWDAATGKS